MIKIVMIIFLLGGSTDGGAAIERIEGFTSMAQCKQEAQKFPLAVANTGTYSIGITKAHCIEVK
jgi:hypothetical protein